MGYEANSELVPIVGDPEKAEVIYGQSAQFRPRPKRGRKCYVTPAFSGVPNAKRGDQNQNWLHHPCLLGGPKEGRNAMSPLHSQGSPTPSVGIKIRSGYITLAFSGAQKREEMLCHPCILGDPQ